MAHHFSIAGVAELADAPDLGSGAARRGGSSPFTRIFYFTVISAGVAELADALDSKSSSFTGVPVRPRPPVSAKSAISIHSKWLVFYLGVKPKMKKSSCSFSKETAAFFVVIRLMSQEAR